MASYHRNNPEEIGIGRQIAEAALADFTATLQEDLPCSARFEPRPMPGVAYVNAYDLRTIQENGPVRPPVYSKMTAWVGEVVTAFCANGALDNATAHGALSVGISNIKFKRRDSPLIVMHLADPGDNYYPGGYLIEGEKKALRHGLGMPPSSQERQAGIPARVELKLGYLLCSQFERRAAAQHMAAVRHAMRSRVTLQPVGPVSSLTQ